MECDINQLKDLLSLLTPYGATGLAAAFLYIFRTSVMHTWNAFIDVAKSYLIKK